MLAGCGAAVVAVGAAAPGASAAGGPETDLAYHGSAALSGGRVDLLLTPHNHGASAVPDSTVRLRWSEPLADRQVLPEGCARAAERTVTCRVGALEADRAGEPVGLQVRLRGVPSEVLLELDTVADGGVADGGVEDGGVEDGGRGDGPQRVLVLDTGDTYYF
ncbi:hypothetical protein STVIR_3673 [Streptomyces viridochromogenes Tue57]|uniref:Lipoprotein n=1 Tax=Streptomyces viridochromogenes Tue57 TaxID=1160705 RepID=L8PCY2_STRVR|nr:hypothetical protein STVIR_3673 [Streptomyces viridochromogenes Tue57]